jgi:phage-related protein
MSRITGVERKKEWRIVYYVGRDAIVILEIFAKTTRATARSVIENCTRRLARYQKDAGEVS